MKWRTLFGSRVFLACLCVAASAVAVFSLKTLADLQPIPGSLDVGGAGVRKPQVTDRSGRLLSITFLNRWNSFRTPLHQFPDLLQRAFVESEDRRFYSHGGVDWLARFHAVYQNLRAGRSVRGASTISEQVVRMLHPRPRTVWSRWLEGIEASRLEKRFTKSEILEFYLNQVPYAHQRRGAAEAALYYFDRTPDTLNAREMLALAVLVRAPSSLDPKRKTKGLERGIGRLAGHMLAHGFLTQDQYREALSRSFEFAGSSRIVEAGHFVQHLMKSVEPELLNAGATLASTLDGDLQDRVRRIVESRLEGLRESDVRNAGVLVVSNETGEVLAWVSASAPSSDSGGWLDAVTTARQPGSALKPFLYALAMEMGWTPATLIEDAPLFEPVKSGLHGFHNYSRTFYGPLRLREALGNSLNTPAVRTIQFTGAGRFLEWLRSLGMRSLDRSPDYYGQGLALGDGEVTLFELVQAYCVLARGGRFLPLGLLADRAGGQEKALRVMSEKTAALVSDILSDPMARRLEFGEGHLFRFPVQTAIKTGTSTDHRDCWAVGFSARYTVGVWMGNMDRRPTRGITGALGPALVLRSVFAELNRYGDTRPLGNGQGLVPARVCALSGLLAGPDCPVITELFVPENVPTRVCSGHAGKTAPGGRRDGGDAQIPVRLAQPFPGLRIAFDPRIPPESQAFAFKLPREVDASRVEWVVDGEVTAGTSGGKYLWPVSRGEHVVKARVWVRGATDPVETPEVNFVVR